MPMSGKVTYSPRQVETHLLCRRLYETSFSKVPLGQIFENEHCYLIIEHEEVEMHNSQDGAWIQERDRSVMLKSHSEQMSKTLFL